MVWLYFLVSVVAIAFRYQLGITAACLHVGKHLSGQSSGTGFQDALTPPLSTKISIFVWLLGASSIGSAFWGHGLYHGFGSLAVFVAVSIIAGATIVPSPDSDHFLKLINNSLANRYANFVKSNDTVRAQAAEHLISLLQSYNEGRP
jgi:hypothetical protein